MQAPTLFHPTGQHSLSACRMMKIAMPMSSSGQYSAQGALPVRASNANTPIASTSTPIQ